MKSTDITHSNMVKTSLNILKTIINTNQTIPGHLGSKTNEFGYKMTIIGTFNINGTRHKLTKNLRIN